MTNLLPKPIQRQHRVDLLNHYTLVTGIVVSLGAVLLAACLLVFDQVYRANLTQLKAQKQQEEAQVASYLDVEKKAQTMSTQLTAAVKAQQETSHWASLFRELQTVTPSTVSIASVAFKPGSGAAAKTTITGTAESRRAVGEFELALRNSKLFKNVEIQTSTTSGPVITYTIGIDVNYDQLKGPA